MYIFKHTSTRLTQISWVYQIKSKILSIIERRKKRREELKQKKTVNTILSIHGSNDWPLIHSLSVSQHISVWLMRYLLFTFVFLFRFSSVFYFHNYGIFFPFTNWSFNYSIPPSPSCVCFSFLYIYKTCWNLDPLDLFTNMYIQLLICIVIKCIFYNTFRSRSITHLKAVLVVYLIFPLLIPDCKSRLCVICKACFLHKYILCV